MKVAVLEDEVPARRMIVQMLARLVPTSEVVAELESVEEGRAFFSSGPRVDVVLSDIRLADGSALTLFEEGVVAAPVIFLTAYDTWITEALTHLSIDYLLKPIRQEDLGRALAKLTRLERHFAAPAAREASLLLTRPRARLLARHRGEHRVLPVADVAYFRAEDKLTLAIDRAAKSWVVDRTLAALAGELDPGRFFRVGRGHLVQVDAVASFRSGGRGRLELGLVPPAPEPVLVPADQVAAFRAWIDR